jgi:hypothetical protein
MRTATVTTGVALILIGAAIAWAAPAAGQGIAGGAPERTGSQAQSDQGQVVLRRDGARAAPFDPMIPVLRRDGAQAAPFVPQVGPATVAVDQGFHWDDALIGAAGAYALILLASGAFLLLRRRPSRRLAERPA